MKKLRKIIPVIAICIIGIMLTVIVKKSGHPLTVDTIIEYTPDNTLLAIVVMLTFFALKSLTVVLPLSVLYFACGMMFSPFSALLVSTAGLAVNMQVSRQLKVFVKSIQKRHRLRYISTKIIFSLVL